MSPAVLAGLVRSQSPDHAPHTQEYIRTTAETPEDFTVEVTCSCRVGLTLTVPRTQPPGVKPGPVKISMQVMPGGEADAGRSVKRALDAMEKGKVTDGS